MSLKRRKEKVNFNLDFTTISDIIFTLLLFYILTQNFIPQTPLELPGMKNPEQLESNKINRIEIQENGSLTLNGDFFTIESIPNLQDKNDKQVLIFTHKKAPAGICVELLDRLRGQGIKSVSFAGTLPEKSE